MASFWCDLSSVQLITCLLTQTGFNHGCENMLKPSWNSPASALNDGSTGLLGISSSKNSFNHLLIRLIFNIRSSWVSRPHRPDSASCRHGLKVYLQILGFKMN